MASATAHRLFRCGFRVAMTDCQFPAAVRRAVAFSTALLEGAIDVEGVRAVAYPARDLTWLDGFDFAHIPVFPDPDGHVLRRWRPEIAIDARLAKRNLDDRLDDAPLTIALGPGIEAGRDVDVVVETNRGHDLGRVIEIGMAADNTGIPGAIAGLTWQRVLRTPCAGTFHTRLDIGDMVRAGQTIGEVAGRAIVSGTAGVVRGLLPDGYPVAADQKLGDIDPRGDPRYCQTLSDKARTISGAVLEIVMRALAMGQLRSARPLPSGSKLGIRLSRSRSSKT